MKPVTFVLPLSFLLLAAVGCAAPHSVEDANGNSAAEAATEGNTAAAQALDEVLKADGEPDMTVARTDKAPANIAKWEYRMMAGGFSVTAVKNDGSPSQRVAWGLDGTNMTGIGSDHVIPDGSSKEDGFEALKAFVALANTDYLAAKSAVGETPDLSLSTDLAPQGFLSAQTCKGKVEDAPVETLVGDLSVVGGAILVGVWFFGTGGLGPLAALGAGAVLIVFGGGVSMDHMDWSLYCRREI